MKLWQGQLYRDDRLFILDLQPAQKNKQHVWAVTTRRNVDGFPPVRVDDFPTREAAIAFIQKIEPETPRISLGGNSPQHPLAYADYLVALRKDGVPSAMQIFEMNKANRGGLIIDELSKDDLRGV
jgi:hypothetical protein